MVFQHRGTGMPAINRMVRFCKAAKGGISSMMTPFSKHTR